MIENRRTFLLTVAALVLAGPAFADAPGWEVTKEYFYATVGNRVAFKKGKLDLDAKAKAALDRQIEWLKKNPAFPIVLEGHADEGTAEYCLSLGERRAGAVKTYMVLQGIEHTRITTLSLGKERPLAGMARRVDTVLPDRKE